MGWDMVIFYVLYSVALESARRICLSLMAPFTMWFLMEYVRQLPVAMWQLPQLCPTLKCGWWFAYPPASVAQWM